MNTLILTLLLAGAFSASATASSGGTYNLTTSAIVTGGGAPAGGGVIVTSVIGIIGGAMSGGAFTLTPGPLASVKGAAADATAAHSFPTVFMPSKGHDKITFSQMPARATIKLYTPLGRLVKTLEKNDSTDSLVWKPVANEQGLPLASGVYLFVISTPNQPDRKGKLMIIK